MTNQVLLDSVEQQISMLVVMTRRVIAAIPRQSEAESIVSELVNAHESHLNSLFLNLKQQLRQKDESFQSALARSRDEQRFMESEILRLEQLLGISQNRDLPVLEPSELVPRNTHPRNESLSSSPLPELIDLRTRLRNQLNELERIHL
jgi:hypothetical protein